MKFLRHVRGVIVFGGLTVNTVFWFVPIVVLALVKLALPIAPLRKAITRVLMFMGEAWVAANRWILAGGGALHWQASGDTDFRRDGWYLVVSNHQTWVDILVLQSAFSRRIPFLKFFIKQELVWFPFLGIAWWALDMPFMKRYTPSYLAKHPEKKGKDLEITRKACEKFRDTPTTVINFIEGTRFSYEKREARRSPYRNLLPPRAGGIAIALTSMGELFDAMLDVTIVYPDGVPRFWDMCCGQFVHAIVDVRSRAIDEHMIKGNYEDDRVFRREMHQWLAAIWADKDARVDELRSDSQSGTGVA